MNILIKKLKNINLIKRYVLLAICLHFLASYFSIGFYSNDEHFQILEPVAFLYGFNDMIISDNGYWYWELNYKMRPWLQPILFKYFFDILIFFNINNPFIWTFLLKIILSSIGLLSLIYLFTNIKSYFLIKENNFNYLLFFSFWLFPFLHARTSSENLGLSIFIFSFCFLLKVFENIKEKNNYLIFFFFSILLGFSLVIRLNLIFIIIPIFLWIVVFKFQIKKFFIVLLGVTLALIIGLIIDTIYYNEFHPSKNFVTLTYWNFFYWNIIRGRMADFGGQPFWWYISEISIKLAPVLSIFFIISLIFFWIKKPFNLFTWITFFSLIILSIFSHKEIRYVFPIYIFAPFFISYFFDYFYNFKFKKLFKFFVLVSNFLFLALTTLTPANNKVAAYNYIFNQNLNEKIYFIDENPYLIDGMEPFFYTHFLPEINKIDDIDYKLNQLDTLWILTNDYEKYFNLINKSECVKKFNSYPETLVTINKNWKKQKINWYIVKCN